jgi:hypothetical protein
MKEIRAHYDKRLKEKHSHEKYEIFFLRYI